MPADYADIAFAFAADAALMPSRLICAAYYFAELRARDTTSVYTG